jgi:hypothetical protein
MPTDSENVRLSGAGSDRRTVKSTRMTHFGHGHSIAALRELDKLDAEGLICRLLARAHEGEPVIDRFDVKTRGRGE